MKTASIKGLLDRKISALEGTLARLRAIREGLDDRKITAIIEEDEEGDVVEEVPFIKDLNALADTQRPSLFVRIQRYFASRGNSPASVSEIAAATGVKVTRIRSTFYVARKKDVERIQTGDAILWRLKQPGHARDTGPALIEMNPR